MNEGPIIFAIPALGGGGAERVVVRLTTCLARRGMAAKILTRSNAVQPAYDVDSRVQQLALYSGHAPLRIGRLLDVLRIRRMLAKEKPAAIISFLPKMSIPCVIGARLAGIPIIISERNNPILSHYSMPLRILMRASYPLATGFVGISHGVTNAFSWLRRVRRTTIHNPIDMPPPTQLNAIPEGRFDRTHASIHIGAAGRLVPAKGFDILLRAYRILLSSIPDAQLTIVGEGHRRQELEELARRLGLADHVSLPGRTKDITEFYRSLDLFVLSSRFEGLGNVILEAMREMVPVVSFDCDYGPREIIEDEVSGLLVEAEDVKALSAAMIRLSQHPELRTALGRNGFRRVSSSFSIETITDQWLAFIDRV